MPAAAAARAAAKAAAAAAAAKTAAADDMSLSEAFNVHVAAALQMLTCL